MTAQEILDFIDTHNLIVQKLPETSQCLSRDHKRSPSPAVSEEKADEIFEKCNGKIISREPIEDGSVIHCMERITYIPLVAHRWIIYYNPTFDNFFRGELPDHYIVGDTLEDAIKQYIEEHKVHR